MAMKILDVAQRSPEWYAARCGIPTASEFSCIVTSKGEPSKQRAAYAARLAAEVVAGPDVNQWGGNMDLERGRFLEADARRAYEFMRDATVQEVGFITNDAGTIGCSPDGLVGEDGGLEIKCLNAENHIKVILRHHEDPGDCPTDYVAQVQGCLWLTGRKRWDLVFYHHALPTLIWPQRPDPEFHKALAEGIAAVLRERDRIVKILTDLRNGVSDAPLDKVFATDLMNAG
jgi:hypothetical protein